MFSTKFLSQFLKIGIFRITESFLLFDCFYSAILVIFTSRVFYSHWDVVCNWFKTKISFKKIFGIKIEQIISTTLAMFFLTIYDHLSSYIADRMIDNTLL